MSERLMSADGGVRTTDFMVSDYSQAWSPPLCSDPTLRSTLPDGALVEAFIFPDTGRGLRVTRAVAKGEELLAVPLDDCWHAADARKCAELQPLLESGAALSDFDASVLQLLLSRAGKTSVSELRKAHLAEMPSAYNSTLFWSDADMAELKGSPWQQLAERLAEEVAADWAALRALVSSAATARPIPEEPVDVADGAADGASDGASAVASATTSNGAPAASSAGSSSTIGPCLDFLEEHSITWDDYLWAYATLKSRAAEASVEGVSGVRLMAPGFDLMNHDDSIEPGTSHYYDAARRALIAVAPRDYAAGEQACISYGAASNGSLLLVGGFVLPAQPGNRFDHVEISLTTLVAAPDLTTFMMAAPDASGATAKTPFEFTQVPDDAAIAAAGGAAPFTTKHLLTQAEPLPQPLLTYVRLDRLNGEDLELYAKRAQKAGEPLHEAVRASPYCMQVLTMAPHSPQVSRCTRRCASPRRSML